MSTTALLDRPAAPAPVRHLRAVTRPVPTIDTSAPTPAPAPVQAAPAQTAPAQPARHLPPGTAPRGFALYVGIDEAKAAASGVSLGVLVEALRRTLGELAPEAETYATEALAPVGSGGRDVDVVRPAVGAPDGGLRDLEPEGAVERDGCIDVANDQVQAAQNGRGLGHGVHAPVPTTTDGR